MNRGIAAVEGARIYYEIEGEGSPVVFINPGAFNCRIWDPQWAAFAARHRVLRYDPSRVSRVLEARGRLFPHV